MSKIKVGQIYEDEDGWRLCITLYSPVDIYAIYHQCGHYGLLNFR